MSTDDYSAFIASKQPTVTEVGFEPKALPSVMFPHQNVMTATAVRRGRAALFAECGHGKSLCELAWAQQVAEHTGKPVLILAPLAVAQQTVREGDKFGIPCRYAKTGDDVKRGEIVITNYERLAAFSADQFSGLVCDESSALKQYAGVRRRQIQKAAERVPYRLACSATPAPNDHLELGQQSEFLDVLSSHQMLARWFINDFEAGHYRLKGHAIESFWDWCASWASMCMLPSDIDPSFSDDGYVLPELRQHTHVVDVDVVEGRSEGMLFRVPSLSSTSIHDERRRTADARARRIADLITSEPGEPWLIWSETDYEADAIAAVFPEACNVKGSDSLEAKERALLGFQDGSVRVLITKPKLAGLGLNFQHCARMVFASSTYSFESWYQAVRRCWRFKQERAVDAHMFLGTTELGVIDVLNRKKADFEMMREEMMMAARRRQHKRASDGKYLPSQLIRLPHWLVTEERKSA
jgi:hypothetical protein